VWGGGLVTTTVVPSTISCKKPQRTDVPSSDRIPTSGIRVHMISGSILRLPFHFPSSSLLTPPFLSPPLQWVRTEPGPKFVFRCILSLNNTFRGIKIAQTFIRRKEQLNRKKTDNQSINQKLFVTRAASCTELESEARAIALTELDRTPSTPTRVRIHADLDIWPFDLKYGSWFGQPPKCNPLVLGPGPTASKNFIEIRLDQSWNPASASPPKSNPLVFGPCPTHPKNVVEIHSQLAEIRCKMSLYALSPK